MSMYELKCQKCGGELQQKGDFFECGYCHSSYASDNVQKEREMMEELFDEQKQERIASLRHMLWEEIHSEYIDSEKIIELCISLQKIKPDDFEARFFEVANGGNGRQLNAFLDAIDVSRPEENFWVEEVVKFMIKSLRAENLLSLNDLIERAYKNTDLEKYEKYATHVSDEAKKVEGGIYEPELPRDVFVMYSSKDFEKVKELVYTLEESGLKCFVAMRNLQHGRGAVANYQKALETAMDNCKIVVFLSSKNSRSLMCDAVKVEIPYLRKKDIMNAPYEYRMNYEQMPLKYKKPRVEYRLDNEGRGGGDFLVKEFFGALEYTYSAEEVLTRVIKYLTQGVEDPVKARPTEKYCLACGTKNPAKNKFCLECGGHDFAESKEAYEKSKLDKEKQARKKAEEEKQALLEELNRLKEAQRQAEEAAKERAAKEKEEAEKAALKVLEEEETRKAAEEERRLKEIEKVEKEAAEKAKREAEERARKEKEAAEKAKKEAEEKAEAAKKTAATDAEKLLQEAKEYNQKKDYTNAFPLFEQLANQKNPEAIAYTAQYYLNGYVVMKNYVKALQLAKESAELGNPFGMNLVGYIYDLGLSVPKDQKTAAEWYQKAANLGSPSAQSNLGNCYYNGWGVAKDYAKSFEWISKSAAQGNAMATLHLGRAYENGHGTIKNYEKAEEYYRKADELGIDLAVKKLKELSLRLTREGYPIKPLSGVQRPTMYETNAKQLVEKGRDFWTKKNYCSAFEYFKKAAATGDKEGQYELAQCYQTGHGVPLGAEEIGKCNEKAVNYARMSAEQNYAPAQYLYGQMLSYKRAHTDALSYFEKAALQDYAPAYARVANYYKEGNDWGYGIRKNLNKAFEWYQKAVQHDPKYQKEVDALQKIFDERKAAKQKKAEDAAFAATSTPKKETVKPTETKPTETKPTETSKVEFPEVTAEQIEKAKQGQTFYDVGLKHLKEGKPNDAIKSFALGSLFGHAGCVHEWGKAFMQGIGPHSVDHKKAFEKFFEAAHLPNPPKEVYADVAACYLHGVGVEKDLQKSLEWYERAAVVEEKYKEHVKIVRSKLSAQNANSTVSAPIKPAPVKPAPVKSTPISAPTKAPVKAPVSAPVKTPAAPSVPPVSAPTTTQKTAAQKKADGEAYYRKAQSTIDSTRKNDFLQLAADNDHVQAMYELGKSYLYGWGGLVKNPQKAFDLFTQATSKAGATAEMYYDLGMCYTLGRGTKIDHKKAFDCFTNATHAVGCETPETAGKVYSQLGSYYEIGAGTQKDEVKALACYEKAAEHGSSKMKVAEFYLEGKGGKKRKKEAIAIYKEIARNSTNEKLKKEAAAILDKLLLFGWRG